MTDNRDLARQNLQAPATQGTRPNDGKYQIDEARIMFRNFEGKPGQFNAAGQRNFHVLLPPDAAEALELDGFNVKYLKPREEGDVPQAHLKINVKMDSRQPPKIFIVTSKGRRQLTEDMLQMVDWADFANIDLIFSRYKRDWPDGRTTVTAYLQTFFGTIREDELELRYADVPELESAQNTLVFEQIDDDTIENDKRTEMDVVYAEEVPF
jgi:hypothetical protein